MIIHRPKRPFLDPLCADDMFKHVDERVIGRGEYDDLVGRFKNGAGGEVDPFDRGAEDKDIIGRGVLIAFSDAFF